MELNQILSVSGGGAAPDGTTLLLSDDEVRRSCDMAAMVDAIEAALGDAPGPQLAMPPRSNLAVEGTFFRVMPAITSRAGVLGLKMLHGSFERGVRYLVVLCDIETGAVTSVLDAAYLTAARTGATAGLATRHLAREDAATVGVIGAGLEAETNLAAVAAVRKIQSVKVFSPRSLRREAFAERMAAELDIEVVPVDTAQAAVAAMDVVVVATNTGSGGPVALRGEWIEPGQHIVSIGSTTPSLREIDVPTFTRADAVVFDAPADAVASESGDVLAWRELDGEAVSAVPTVTELLRAEVPGRRRADDVTVFKSIGAATQDLAGAVAVCERARALKIGTEVRSVAVLKTF
ncbi:ornithine cyclodeaminase family protein [Streptantibioticus ferralitis]|uniref:Ornithine cyclodeaminase family protein n=1 Tax=Streptantibioticus ferralitis TaxID=236510 RepID=A0ABT5Z8U1_9ACTN|nr:ornithine cyclodeaminase family protein [Streptantibioticus ferralitis]MDF2260226.1 ornithine cyclodeaminase family protein [Streptantibioticus ferralitis]